MSTQQLLEALELQRRQATERKALGLPPISPSVEKVKKPSATKKVFETKKKNPKLTVFKKTLCNLSPPLFPIAG